MRWLVVLCAVMVACGGDGGAPDGGTDRDAGLDASRDVPVGDAGAMDSGADVGVADSGTRDAGRLDSGQLDSGQLDSGVSDSGTSAADDAGFDAGVEADAGLLPCERGECIPGSYCAEETACGGSGVCAESPVECPRDCPGVCACDGRSFCNACVAHQAGVDVTADRGCLDIPCTAAFARGVGPCPRTVGFAWNGVSCYSVEGCDCTGDCSDLSPTLELCEARHRHCEFVLCGRGETCLQTHWCDIGSCGTLPGYGLCRLRPLECTEPAEPVCGCDGMTYSSACEAQMAGQTVARRTACE